RSARSRFTRTPGPPPARVVRRSVSGDTSTVKRRPRRAVTVRHAPLTATLSPSVRPSSPAIVRRTPVPCAARRSTRPIVWMMPLNRALCLRPEEGPAEPGIALAVRDLLELLHVEPHPAAAGTLLGRRALMVA